MKRTRLPRASRRSPEHSPELKETFEQYRKTLGFIPNSVLIMQRKPKMVKGLAQLLAAIWEPDGAVDRGFKRLVAHVASRSAGCQYCMRMRPAVRCWSASTRQGRGRVGLTDSPVTASASAPCRSCLAAGRCRTRSATRCLLS
jgi:alkylhydroperoxidase family enzyme